MPKLFASSTTEECAMLASSTDRVIEVNLSQHYVFKSAVPFKKEGAAKTVNSKLTFRLNEDGLIEQHDEEWDHKGNKTEEDGFVGKMMEGRKKAGAKMVEKMVSSDPSKV